MKVTYEHGWYVCYDSVVNITSYTETCNVGNFILPSKLKQEN